jgi:DNA helicase II / ATP-dependent DNA helicase PcrA
LVYDKNGLLRLKPEIAKECDKQVPSSCRSRVSFMLVTEISNIYKKDGKTRKNHNLLFVPDLDAATRLGVKLSAIGNVKSDGRPILGLDARNLLEILLETTDRGFFVPAHIWTPWFSILGSKSGFDSVRECFEDLTSYIYAVETGLSSDPPMNWRVSELENLTLISNSDAHSPANLGREANIFDTDIDYDSIIEAMKSGNPDHFLGTLEFYPEEGKYHYDGHRKCEISFHPEQTLSHNNVCPVCEKPLTLGVLYRVNALSDRPEGVTPARIHSYDHIIPLTDILSEILLVGPRTKKVLQNYRSIVEKLGPELNILKVLSLEKIEKAGIPLLKESIGKMREKKIKIDPGYDGEFGRVKIFEKDERESLLSKKLLFHMPVKETTLKKKKSIKKS